MPTADGTVPATESAVPPSEVRAVLDKLLTSPEFVASPQLCAFLAYIVEAHLAGEDHLLKGQNIGTAVLGRPVGFDSQRDPIVRVEANRLRRTLVAYYMGSGAGDAVRIVVGRGSYVPRIERVVAPALPPPDRRDVRPGHRPAPELVARSSWRSGRLAILIAAVALVSIAVAGYGALSRLDPKPAAKPVVVETAQAAVLTAAPQAGQPYLPSVEVSPFTMHAAGKAAERGTELASMLTVALAGFPELRVLANGGDAADFRVDGEVTLGDAANTVAMRLSVADTADVIWSANVALKPEELTSNAGFERVVEIATTAIAPQFGAIAQHLASGEDSEGVQALADYDCLINAQLQHHRLEDGNWKKLEVCLRESIARYPNFATATASLALLLIEGYRLNPAESAAQASLVEADSLARRALQLEPANVRAMTAVAAAALGKDDLDAAKTMALRAITANPLDPLSRSQYVLALIASGYQDQALAQSVIARQIDPAHVGFYDSLDYLAHFGKGTQPNPLRSAVVADVPHLPYGAMARVLAYDSSDQHAARDEAKAALYALMPLFADDMPAALRRQFPPSPFTQRLEAALRKAGVGS